MKKQFFKTNTTRFSSAAIFSAMLLFSSFNGVLASDNNEKTTPVAVTFTGTTNDVMTFNVKYNNPNAEVFALEISDDQGRILYQRKYNDKEFNQNILLKNLGEKVRVSFAVRAGKNSVKQRFDIEPKTRVVEELVVTKL